MSLAPASTRDKIDYIRLTFPMEVGYRNVLPDFGMAEEWLSKPSLSRAWLGYNKSIPLPFGGAVMWHTDRADMGICLQMAGQCLDALNADVCHPSEVIKYAYAHNARATRIDYAIDIVSDTFLSVTDALSATELGILKFKGQEYGIVGKTSKNSLKTYDKGITLQLGSRTSPRCMRFYDKSAEQKIMGVSWTRIELEVKKARVNQLMRDMAKGDWITAGRSQVFDYFTVSTDDESKIASWYRSLRDSVTTYQPEKIRRSDEQPNAFISEIVLPFLRKKSPMLTDDNLFALRSLINGELWARNNDDASL